MLIIIIIIIINLQCLQYQQKLLPVNPGCLYKLLLGPCVKKVYRKIQCVYVQKNKLFQVFKNVFTIQNYLYLEKRINNFQFFIVIRFKYSC